MTVKQIIYIPGLGKQRSLKWQKAAMLFWPKLDTKIHVFESNWYSKELFDDKYQRLERFVADSNIKKSDELIIIGVSAGGPLAVVYAHNHPGFKKAFFIAGKLRRPGVIGRLYRLAAPALLDVVTSSEAILNTHPDVFKDRSVVIQPKRDRLIAKKDMLVPGSKLYRIPFAGHSSGIMLSLLFGMPFLLRRT